jgi:hypothetical protein
LRAQQRANALDMKSTWDSMQKRFADFNARQATLAAQVTRARGGGGVEALGGNTGAFDEFQAIEERIAGVDDVLEAQREVDAALEASQTGSGMSRAEVELRFRELEGNVAAGPDATANAGLEEELTELKQKLRVRVQ